MISNACVQGRETVYRLGPCDPARRGEYQQKTAEILAIDFPPEYYDRAEILTLIDQQGRMCAGVVIVQQAPFRSLLAIPQSAEDPVLAELITANDVAEINGVWLAPDLKTPILPVTFWRQLIACLLTMDKHRFLFTFDRGNKPMRKLTSWLRYDVLYSGPTQQLVGMHQPADETIGVLHRDSFLSLNETLQRFEGSAIPSYDTPRDGLDSR